MKTAKIAKQVANWRRGHYFHSTGESQQHRPAFDRWRAGWVSAQDSDPDQAIFVTDEREARANGRVACRRRTSGVGNDADRFIGTALPRPVRPSPKPLCP
jgi:hypothetical protein